MYLRRGCIAWDTPGAAFCAFCFGGAVCREWAVKRRAWKGGVFIAQSVEGVGRRVLQSGPRSAEGEVRSVAREVREVDEGEGWCVECGEQRFDCSKALIKEMPGGFDAMNDFVRETICRALEASHDHYEQTFRGLIGELTSRVASARGDASFEPPQNHSFGPPLSPAGAPLPTLLPRQTMPSLGQRADFVSLKGQENPTEDVYPLP
eukprot:s1144_g1.t1